MTTETEPHKNPVTPTRPGNHNDLYHPGLVYASMAKEQKLRGPVYPVHYTVDLGMKECISICRCGLVLGSVVLASLGKGADHEH